MKKILVLCLIIALGLGVMGASCLNNLQGKVCNPPADTMAAANAVIELLKPVLNTLVPGTAAFDAYITASNIAAGVCVTVTALNGLINFVQGINEQAALAAVKAKKMAPAPLPVQPFINWRDGKK